MSMNTGWGDKTSMELCLQVVPFPKSQQLHCINDLHVNLHDII